MTDKKMQRGAGVAAVLRQQTAFGPAGQQAVELISQHVEPASRQTGMAEEKQKPVKATYYMDAALIKSLKFLSVERGRDLSAMVNEAVRDLLAKHSGQ